MRQRPGQPGQRGFSLLEMATVLFLIGLMLGGTLRGQELINAGHLNRLADDYRHIPLLISVYQDKFRSLPGDDRNAEEHLGASAQRGNGNGVMDGNWYDTGASSEASRAWQHLRLAGLVGGATNFAAPDYLPQNALGHSMGLQPGTDDPGRTPIRDASGAALPGAFILCSRGIPGNLVQPLDIKLDDGNPATGRMLATEDTAAYNLGAAAATVATNVATDIRPERSYIVCMGF